MTEQLTEMYRLMDEGDWLRINYFAHSEFVCRGKDCDCDKSKQPSYTLVRFLDILRGRLGRPLILNDAIRCPAHNKAVGGAVKSAHLFGLACDIHAPTSKERYELMERIFATKGYISRIGIYEWGLHIDCGRAPDYATHVIWRGK